jgi:hypothetical protein
MVLAGTKLRSHEITALIAKGGIGEVDCARDLVQQLFSCVGEHQQPDH